MSKIGLENDQIPREMVACEIHLFHGGFLSFMEIKNCNIEQVGTCSFTHGELYSLSLMGKAPGCRKLSK